MVAMLALIAIMGMVLLSPASAASDMATLHIKAGYSETDLVYDGIFITIYSNGVVLDGPRLVPFNTKVPPGTYHIEARGNAAGSMDYTIYPGDNSEHTVTVIVLAINPTPQPTPAPTPGPTATPTEMPVWSATPTPDPATTPTETPVPALYSAATPMATQTPNLEGGNATGAVTLPTPTLMSTPVSMPPSGDGTTSPPTIYDCWWLLTLPIIPLTGILIYYKTIIRNK